MLRVGTHLVGLYHAEDTTSCIVKLLQANKLQEHIHREGSTNKTTKSVEEISQGISFYWAMFTTRCRAMEYESET